MLYPLSYGGSCTAISRTYLSQYLTRMTRPNDILSRDQPVSKGTPRDETNCNEGAPVQLNRDSVDTVTVPTLRNSRRWATALATVLVCAATITAAIGAQSPPMPMSIIYDSAVVTHQLVFPVSGRGLSPARGAFRQDPGGEGVFAPGNSAPDRISKINASLFTTLDSVSIANLIRAQIVRGTYGALAHMVAIDEIGVSYGEPGPAHPRRGSRLPRIDPNCVASRFSQAMQLLNATESPWGGTWASRVHVYIANGMTGSIARGLGPLHNLDRLGRPRYPTWRAVMPGIAVAGGVHLEMYHLGAQGIMPIPASQWHQTPRAFLALLARYQGSASRVHWVFTSTAMPPGAPAGCGSPMTCSWVLAESTTLGRMIVQNGPDAYKLGGYAADWLQQFNLVLP